MKKKTILDDITPSQPVLPESNTEYLTLAEIELATGNDRRRISEQAAKMVRMGRWEMKRKKYQGRVCKAWGLKKK